LESQYPDTQTDCSASIIRVVGKDAYCTLPYLQGEQHYVGCIWFSISDVAKLTGTSSEVLQNEIALIVTCYGIPQAVIPRLHDTTGLTTGCIV